jgi:hypothetical protein
MIFKNIETKIKIGKEINSAPGQLWPTASAQRTAQSASLHRPQVPGAAQPTPQMTETGPRHRRGERAHRAHAMTRPPAATQPARRGTKAGKSTDGARPSRWREAVVQPGAWTFAGGGGMWSPVVSSDDSCRQGRRRGR